MTPHAAIDIGTHSTRLLIATRDDGGELFPLEQRSIITKLGTGVDKSGRISESGMQATLDVLAAYSGLCRDHKVTRIRAVATSAMRDADNREVFLERAEAIIGARPEVISGDEEAATTFAGAAYGLGNRFHDSRTMVFDIGGGSTEVIIGERGAIIARESTSLGCLRLTERFLHSDPPTVDEIESTVEFCGNTLSSLASYGSADLTGVGVAGTITTLVAIRDSIDPYDSERVHHQWLRMVEVDELIAELASVPLELRRQVIGLQPARADVIVAGAIVVRTVMTTFGLDKVLVSETDILEGILLTTYGTQG